MDTAQRYFAKRQDLLLLEIETEGLQDVLRWEAPLPVSEATKDQRFPHIYKKLSLENVLAVYDLEWREEKGFQWPKGLQRKV